MLYQKKSHIIHDGRVVMVALSMCDSLTGEVFEEVGRAICNLEEDTFDLQVGISLASQRAKEKIIKKAIKNYEILARQAENKAKEFHNQIAKLKKQLL